MITIPYWLFIAFIYFSFPSALFHLALIGVGVSLGINAIIEKLMLAQMDKERRRRNQDD